MVTVNKIQIQYRQGMTVDDALKEAGEEISPMVIVIVNGKVISRGDRSKTRINDKAEIRLLPLISGG